MNMRKYLAAAALLAFVAGCGGSDDAGSSGDLTPQAMAEKIDCSAQPGTGRSDDPLVKGYGECTYPMLRLYTFADNTVRDSWLKVAQRTGGTFAIGDR